LCLAYDDDDDDDDDDDNDAMGVADMMTGFFPLVQTQPKS